MKISSLDGVADYISATEVVTLLAQIWLRVVDSRQCHACSYILVLLSSLLRMRLHGLPSSPTRLPRPSQLDLVCVGCARNR